MNAVQGRYSSQSVLRLAKRFRQYGERGLGPESVLPCMEP